MRYRRLRTLGWLLLALAPHILCAQSAPTIASISPTSGTVGTSITITGTNFGTTQGTSTVSFNGTASAPTSWSNTSITTTVPSGATTGNLLVTVGGQSSNGVGFMVNNGPVSYAYDDLNRLVGVSDAAGNAAAYSYDANGNILSISHLNAGQASILSFNPSKGTVASVVTITGAGFSATPSQNAVLFNGVAATVTSSSTTQIVTSVPAGATSGTLMVTSPLGSATSASSFTVTSSGIPNITGFTPTIATPGTTISVTGTNFDPTPSKDFTQFNTTYSPVSSAMANGTNISVNVPTRATSGHVGVTTPGGRALSSADLFVPPTPYQAADVGFTSRMSLGGTSTITIPTANKIGMMLFDGTTGHRVTMNITNSNLACNSVLSLIGPGNTTAGAPGSISICGSSKLVQPVSLTNTGTHTIVVPPQTSSGASLSLALYDTPPDVTNLITIDGPPVTYSTTVGQDIRLPFFTTAGGQRVVLYMTAVSYPQANFYLLNPDTSQHAYLGISNSGYPNNQFFLDTQTLSTVGKYTLWVSHINLNTGTATLQLKSVPPDITGPIAVDGAAVPVGPTAVGQNAVLSFTTTSANQRVVVYVTAVSTPVSNVDLLNPNGTQHAYMGISNSGYPNNTFFMDTQTLTTIGTYAVQIRHSGTNVGSETVQVKSVPADVSGSLSINGSSLPFTTVVGQNASITFNNPQTQTVSVRWTGDNYASCNLYVNGPSPSTNQVAYSPCQTGTSVKTLTNLASGTYTIQVNPPGTATGGMTLSVTSP